MCEVPHRGPWGPAEPEISTKLQWRSFPLGLNKDEREKKEKRGGKSYDSACFGLSSAVPNKTQHHTPKLTGILHKTRTQIYGTHPPKSTFSVQCNNCYYWSHNTHIGKHKQNSKAPFTCHQCKNPTPTVQGPHLPSHITTDTVAMNNKGNNELGNGRLKPSTDDEAGHTWKENQVLTVPGIQSFDLVLFCIEFHHWPAPFNGNYPRLTTANFLQLSDHVSMHDADISEVIRSPKENAHFLAVANGILSEKGSCYQGLQFTQQSIEWTVLAGYYGLHGTDLIRQAVTTIVKHFNNWWSDSECYTPEFVAHIAPLTVSEFLIDVLVAEATAHLILDDMHHNETKGLPQMFLRDGPVSLQIHSA
ncbi:hypothetical protein BS47DRAFT_1369822 [Hydnum rufescens UP504]|uniref:Restriction of telomere capping protein 4 C-terminal domain-containing protein n=1 Tax=Hydnum rufescens UP504 TaxID=1448309 RepID=A0A9P6ACY5_9AGAM|nr:hypothetical protein BS47DRAFT_1369822 [Hydnum rufescens UP504]